MMKKKLLKALRRVKSQGRSDWFRGGMPIVDGYNANQRIKEALLDNHPYMVARFGSTEIKPTLYYSVLRDNSGLDNAKLYINGDIDYIFDSDLYQDYMVGIMCNNAGFFPRDASLLPRFAQMMVQDTKQIDMCGCWLNEKLLLPYFNTQAEFCKLGALEPYDYNTPWTSSLEGKKVLVIHPFEESIRTQYKKRELLWDNQDVLPEFELKTIKAVQSIAGETVSFKNWFEALDHMKQQMDETDYDVAIIGCGAYGLPLAAHVKRKGKKAIHLGGPLQILFGIKGARWDNMPSVSKYYNEYWVRPLSDEIPVNNEKVENSCYW